jgi:hypothetical protein
MYNSKKIINGGTLFIALFFLTDTALAGQYNASVKNRNGNLQAELTAQNGELKMLNLQSSISQRAAVLQQTTNMLNSMNEAANEIAKNIGGGGSKPPSGTSPISPSTPDASDQGTNDNNDAENNGDNGGNENGGGDNGDGQAGE